MPELASYMKGDTCATKGGRNAPMSLLSLLHKKHSEGGKGQEKRTSQVPPSPLFEYELALTAKVKPGHVSAQGLC